MSQSLTRAALFVIPLFLLSCPPPKSSKDPLNCESKSNAIKVGNQCQCAPGFRRQVSAGDFFCVEEPGYCAPGAVLNNNSNKCVCTNGNTYHEGSNNPCGGSSNQVGLSVAQLESACRGVGQWSNGFCACANGQQFNALSRRCEPIVHHHTRAMCGSGAKFYGQGDRGVCICNNPGSYFNPSFGGCTTSVSVTTSQTICATLYGGNWDANSSRCDCNNSGVWFRGSCLNLGNDFFTTVPGLPIEVQCEAKGGRVINGNCQTYGSGGVGSIYGYTRSTTCDRRNARLKVDERVIIYPDRIEVIDFEPFKHSPRRYRYNNPKDYFKDRCINKAVSASGMWLRGFGTYLPNIGSPTFGSCRCAHRFITKRHPDLGYEYCVEGNTGNQDPMCYWDWRRDTQVSVTFDPNTGIGVSGCINRNGRKYCVSSTIPR